MGSAPSNIQTVLEILLLKNSKKSVVPVDLFPALVTLLRLD